MKMMQPTIIYKPYTIVVVPFPFTDQNKFKKRPALVISSSDYQKQTQHVTLAMITTAKHSHWLNDQPIIDWEKTGLPFPSIIRQKIFTIDLKLIIKALGELSPQDKTSIRQQITTHLLLNED